MATTTITVTTNDQASQSQTPTSRPTDARSVPGSVNIPVATWPPSARDASSVDPASVAGSIVRSLNEALASNDVDAIGQLFYKGNCYLRDHLALSWELRTLKGQEAIIEFLKGTEDRLKKVEIDNTTGFGPPLVMNLDIVGTTKGIWAFFTFETEKGKKGKGWMRLAQQEEDGQWKIWTFFTTLRQTADVVELTHHSRPQGVSHGADPDRRNWKERRDAEVRFGEGSDPAVLIIGAGQAGLSLHARLKALGISCLIVDSNGRIGDNWRNRYRQLVLHDPVWYDHMPYLNFPPTWPVFTPKDKLADFFESYATLLELNVWMGTEIKASKWDDSSKSWTVDLHRRSNGKTTTLRPKHIVQATGHSGEMNFPAVKGMADFQGDLLCHSSQFPGANPESGRQQKRAIVVGSCNSSHDICQDYFEKGYHITMVQRSSTFVASSKFMTEVVLAGLYDENAPPVEDSDIWLWGTPSEVLKAMHVQLVGMQKEFDPDKETLDGLERAGFKLDVGPDGAGLLFKYYQRGGGYYIDVGASKLIVDGKIKVKQGCEITEVTPKGLKFDDGSELEADEIIFATGYQNMRTQTRQILGPEAADRIGDVWGLDKEGEFRTIWRRSGHPGLWIMGGNLALCRYNSRVLALQIQAALDGRF